MSVVRKWKKLILALIDIALINLAYIVAFYFRFTFNIPRVHIQNYKKAAIILTMIYLFFFYVFKLYESLWNYAGIDEFLLGIAGCVLANLFCILYGRTIGPLLPYSVTILAGMFCGVFVIGFRMTFRIYRRGLLIIDSFSNKDAKRVMVIGAGSAGALIVKEMKGHGEKKYKPIVIIDDSQYKIGTSIAGVKVIGGREIIEEVVQELNIDTILLAIPSLNKEQKKEIIDICKKTGCQLKTMPGVYELLDADVNLSKIRDVDVEDLLGREPIKLDNAGIADYIKGRTVIVTGGGGSIGSELCRQIAKFEPRLLLILDIYENNAYDLQNELKHSFPKLNLKVLVASVREKGRLEQIFEEYKPEVVFHAAAHKHVPLMEDSPMEAVKNNAFGTLNTAECADKYGVKRFVLISTDKAVNPTNVMGATKRMCEMIIQAMNKKSKTEFVAVRFGNVLGSNGSVIPLFKKQIAQGGPVTVTNKYITRFFMTIPEAAQLVLQAGAYAKGGEIFVLDMGQSVKIYDLACDLIRLSGYEPHEDIKIEVTGLRPGEKLYEEMLMDEEGLESTRHDKIFVGRPTFDDMEKLMISFDELRDIIKKGNREELIYKVGEIVPTYKMPKVEEMVAVTKDIV